MKRFTLEFLRRGAIAAGIGPIILVVLYMIMHNTAGVETLSVNQVCIAIASLTLLAFIAGGLNALYQIERMPLLVAVLIHGSVLYFGYLVTYLVNDWLDLGIIPIVVFSVIFIVGYIVIWAIIYSIIRRNTARINEMLKQRNA